MSASSKVRGQREDITMTWKLMTQMDKQNVSWVLFLRGFIHVHFSGWPFSNRGPWGRRTVSAPSWGSPPPNRQAARRHELRSYVPMRLHTWRGNRTTEGCWQRCRRIQYFYETIVGNQWEPGHLLCIVEFILVVQPSPFYFLHHLPPDSTRSDDVEQIDHWQTGADQLVLETTWSDRRHCTWNHLHKFSMHTCTESSSVRYLDWSFNYLLCFEMLPNFRITCEWTSKLRWGVAISNFTNRCH